MEGGLFLSKQSVAVLFGGASSEHEISLLSAYNVLSNLNQTKYNIYPVGIQKNGTWHLYEGDFSHIADGTWHSKKTIPAAFCPGSPYPGLVLFEENGVRSLQIDVVFPVLHGKNGEDGTIQGLLETAGIAYVGCGVLGSAVCMDKMTANYLMDASGIARCQWASMEKYQLPNLAQIETEVAAKLSYPIFVKPANAGSSVGISKAHNRDELTQAVHLAFEHDSRIIFEEFIQGREIECAVCGNDSLFVTPPGEVLSSAEFYTYDDKYLSGTSSTAIPADLPKEIQQQVMQTAQKAYRALSCCGLARVDFFLEHKTNRLLLNEINTLPGFTEISMYPKMMMQTGQTYSDLLDQLIQLALERKWNHNA